MRAALLLLALAAAASPAPEDEARPVREVTFEEAVDLALGYNLGLESARLAALIERLRVDEADAAWDPTVNSTVGGGEDVSPSRSSLAGANVVDTDNFNFTLGLTQPFRLGPSLGLEWRTDRTFSNSSFSTINPAYDTALDVSLTVPLLRGRGRTAQEADLRAAQAGAEGARYEFLDAAAQLVQDVAEAYWNLVYLQDQVGVLEKSVEVAREIEATERRKLRPEIGRSTPLDVSKAVAATKQREAALILGRMQARDAADELRRLVLPFTGGKDDETMLRAASVPGEDVTVPELAPLLEDALVRRPDLRRADAELKRLEEAVVKARDNLRVQLDLSAGVTWRGVAGGFSPSASDTIQGDFPSAFGAVTLTWPLGRRAARAALRRAELELERGRIARRDQVNTVVVEVRQAQRGLRTVLQEIVATREEIRAAEESLEGEQLRLKRGTATVLDVAILEENLTEARLKLVESLTALQRARVRIHRVTGTLLERTGVELGPEYEVKRNP